MRLDNVRIYGSEKYHSFEIDEEAGVVINILSSTKAMPTTKNGIELPDSFITPGFVDTHIHGAFGFDTCDGNVDSIVEISKKLALRGISAFCPTTMTVSRDIMFDAIDASFKAKSILDGMEEPHADILGLHLEGPFLNPSKCGVQNVSDALLPTKAPMILDEIEERFPGFLKIVDIAPELEGSLELIEKYSSRYVFSIAHSDADYEIASKAFMSGATSVTHVLNAMNPMLKRSPGILGAAIDSGTYTEVISDGHHIHNSYLKLLYSDVLDNSVITVSDSMRGSGMPDGKYDLGGVEVEVRSGRTYFGPSGDLAGSVTNLIEEFNNLYGIGVPARRIVNSMTVNPLRRIGLTNFMNYEDLIDIDCVATFNIFDSNGKLKGVINRGKILWMNED